MTSLLSLLQAKGIAMAWLEAVLGNPLKMEYLTKELPLDMTLALVL